MERKTASFIDQLEPHGGLKDPVKDPVKDPSAFEFEGNSRVGPELALVIPFYNEQESLAKVVTDWVGMLSSLGCDFELFLISDSSKDNSLAIARQLARSDHRIILVENPKNIGHGQTCLRGYALANAHGATWIMQVDSDGQCDPKYFSTLWSARHSSDVHHAYRFRRLDGLFRWVASRFLELAIYLKKGVWVRDPNSPYRLMRAQAVCPYIYCVPGDFDLGNVALALVLRSANISHSYYPITFLDRYGGKSTTSSGALLTKFRSLLKNLDKLKLPPVSS